VKPFNKKFLQGAGRKAQSAGRKANNRVDAMRKALCAFPLAAGGKNRIIMELTLIKNYILL
jgi:hypothetical protein